MPQYIALPNGGTGEFPDGMPPDQIEGVLSRQFPTADKLSPVVGGIADTVGLTDRPGKRTVADVLLKPEGLLETGAQTATMTGLMGLGGAGLGGVAARLAGPAATGIKGAAQMVGRIGTAGAEGVAKRTYSGDEAWLGLLDAAATGVAEGLTKGIGGGVKLGVGPFKAGLGLKEWGAPARAFAEAPEKAKAALDMIRSRLPAGAWFNVPSLGAGRMTADDALKALATKSGPAYAQARAELAHEMSRLDMQRLTGPPPLAGSVFKANTAKELTPPGGGAKAADAASRALGSQGGKVAADTAATQDIGGAPAGSLPLLFGPGIPSFGSVARQVM